MQIQIRTVRLDALQNLNFPKKTLKSYDSQSLALWIV